MPDGSRNGNRLHSPRCPHGSPPRRRREINSIINHQSTVVVGTVETVEKPPHLPLAKTLARDLLWKDLWKACGKSSRSWALFPLSSRRTINFPQTFHKLSTANRPVFHRLSTGPSPMGPGRFFSVHSPVPARDHGRCPMGWIQVRLEKLLLRGLLLRNGYSPINRAMTPDSGARFL